MAGERLVLKNRLNEIFCDVFDDDIEIFEEMTAHDIEQWDSLKHIMLIVAIEDEFGMKFDVNEISSLENIKEMLDIISARASS